MAIPETQCCYICGKFFEDKVKLGLHLTPCYNEAVGVRKELWHPHPLDLVDEQRYTEYMKGRFEREELRIKEAETKGISFVTADSFEAMRGTLGPVRQSQHNSRPATRDSTAGRPPSHPTFVRSSSRESPLRSGGVTVLPPVGAPINPPQPQHAAPSPLVPSHHSQVAQPVRVVATGVTMLRNELATEIEKLRQLREEEQTMAHARHEQFAQLIGQFHTIQSASAPIAQRPSPSNHPNPSAWGAPQVPAVGAGSGVVNAPTQENHRPHNVSASPPSIPPPSAPPYATGQDSAAPFPRGEIGDQEMPDGRIRCGTCGKYFGKKGFQVHAQRCFRGPEDFTFSRDAKFEKNHPAPNQPVPQLQDPRYSESPALRAGGGGPEPWTQFMTTYPRPVLDEAPKTAKERNQAANDAKRKAEYQAMVAREMSGAPPAPSAEPREATVPCGKCGRYFYESRVAKHEATCVSKPRR